MLNKPSSVKLSSILKKTELFVDKIFVNGVWKSSNHVFQVTDPATGARIGAMSEATVQIARNAIAGAHEAFATFKDFSVRERSQLLRRWADLIRENSEDLAHIVTLENGKPLKEARSEVLATAQNFEWFSEATPHYSGRTIPSEKPDMQIFSFREPVGVVGIITPWNFPALMLARKVSAAVAAGCTAVVKPASETPFTASAIAYLGQEAGLPAGVLNVIPTQSHTKEVGKELTTNIHVAKVSFTGSTAVGRLLMGQASSTVKRLSLELGGNAAFIVFDDANIDKAVAGAIASKYRGSGQTCICADRFFVHEKVHDEFVEKLANRVKQLKVGPGLNPQTDIGPLINQKAVEKVQSHLDDALSKGGELVAGGHRLKDLGENFFEPTIIIKGNQSMAVFHEETFGPLAAIMKISSDAEGVALANSVEGGLASYLYTESFSRALVVSKKLESGMVGLNTGLITEVALPFGGVKQSGFGREGSEFGLDDYTVVKSVACSTA